MLHHSLRSSARRAATRRKRLPIILAQSSFFATGPPQSDSSHPNHLHPESCEIVIVGGGVVGLALANAFATCKAIKQSGYRIKVLEASDLSKIQNWSLPPGQWSNRVSSITNENLEFLKQIGAWKYIDQNRTNPVEQMQVWDGITNARIVFDSLDVNPASYGFEETTLDIPQMARFVENIHLQKALLKNLHHHPNIQLYGSAKVASIEADHANWPIVKMEDGKSFRTRLLIGADGFNSPVKSYSQITSTGWNYDAHCVVGTLELEKTAYNFTAWQRFLTSGPLGFLPLSDQHASLAWSTKPKIAAGLKALNSQTLASIINASFRLPHESVSYLLSRIGSHSPATPIDSNEIQSEIDWRSSSDVINPTDRSKIDEAPPKVISIRMETIASFPLRMFHADQYLGTIDGSVHGSEQTPSRPTRTALVGDAAHVLHPMAGQGLNLGLGDARELSQTVRRAIENGQDIGGLTALAPYARSRYLANHLVMSTVDKLNKIYSTEIPPLVWARSVGVEVLNEIPALKSVMMGNAGGKFKNLSSSNSAGGIWGNVADVYEGLLKAQALFNAVGSFASSTALSAIHRATAPKT